MAIQPVQMNIDTTKSQQPVRQKKVVKPYLEAEGAVSTETLVKPLPPKGHLIKNDLKTGVKYFFNDIAYDAKSIKNGFNGTANDHQLGRLNDIGLKLGGLGIATYLASITTNPKARIMEYVGLGAFLTSMDLYPKLAIYAPAKMKSGYNVGKEYIDDQGRKKSVLQDSNYVPFDMFLAETPDEDLMAIADDMGIPKDAKNRKELAKEQVRKNAIQNQTLWMMTAGFATPILTALICFGLENYVVGPALESQRNSKYNKMISDLLKRTNDMSIEISSDYSNDLSKKVSKFLETYKGKEIPREEFKELLNILTEGLDNEAAAGVKEDVTKLLRQEKKGTDFFFVDKQSVEDAINTMKKSLGRTAPEEYEKILVPSEAEFEELIKKISKDAKLESGVTLSREELESLKGSLRELIDKKINESSGVDKTHLNKLKVKTSDKAKLSLQKQYSYMLPEESFTKLVDLSKILGEFKEINLKLLKCESFKFEYAPETVLARSYAKFEKTFLKELGFTTQELKVMRESEEYAAKLIDSKLTELAKDESHYREVMRKFSDIISDMEGSLHGKNSNESMIKDLITAYENNYHKTAQRLQKLGNGDFAKSIKKLVAEDPATLKNSITSVSDLYAWMDGVNVTLTKELDELKAKMEANGTWWKSGEGGYEAREKYAIEHSKGVGSSKRLMMDRLRARYAGVRNSFNRVIHLMDLYKREANMEEAVKGIDILSNKPEYISELFRKGKESVLRGYTADYILKNETTNNPRLYQDLMNVIFSTANEITGLGNMSKLTKDSLTNVKGSVGGSVQERFGTYLTRFRNILMNDSTDFLKQRHLLNPYLRAQYHKDAISSESRFNLVAKSPLDMIREGAGRKYADTKWLKVVSGIAGGVFGVALLAQLGFGKIRNPHKIEKQVKNESN